MVHEVRMPVLSQSMIQGRVVEWILKEGEKVDKGALLVVVESDKATHELEAPDGGILTKILVEEGCEVDVNTVLAIISEAGESTKPQESSSTIQVTQTLSVTPIVAVTPGDRKPVSPVAKRLAKELGIDVSLVKGNGPNGLVTEKDVRAFAEQHTPTAPPVVAQPVSDDAQIIPLTGQRGRIAERMSLSRHTAADVTTVMDVDMGQVASVRSATGYSYTSYVVWAAAQALQEFPLLNSWIVEDRIVVKRSAHVGVAVAIDGALLVPVLRNAEHKTVAEIDQEIDELSKKARAGQLTPDDMKGSTFTVTNSGVYGSLLFTPIINLPEVAVLGMGKVADTPVVRQGEVVAGKVMYLCLSYDHRAVDGAVAVQFLQSVKQHLEAIE